MNSDVTIREKLAVIEAALMKSKNDPDFSNAMTIREAYRAMGQQHSDPILYRVEQLERMLVLARREVEELERKQFSQMSVCEIHKLISDLYK